MSIDLAAAVDEVFGGEPESKGVNLWLDTGYPPLNKAVSGDYFGGLPCGRIIEIYGPESAGKTAVANQVMASAQRAGGVALFMDHERSFMKDIAEFNGLDVSRSKFSLQYPDSFEESVTKAIRFAKFVRENKVIEPTAPIVIVFDSLASMVPQSKLAKEVDEQGMNDSLALAKACSSVFPTLSLYAEKYELCAIFLNQTREKPGVVYGDNTTTPGGKAPKFYASVRIQLGRSMIKKDGEILGQDISCNVIKNKVSRPFQKCQWQFLFNEDGTGSFDAIGGVVDELCSLGVLKKNGAYIEWDGKKYNRGPLIKIIREEAALREKLFALLPRHES